MALVGTNIEIQVSLGLPELKRTETRRALATVFQVYRQYKMLLRMGLDPVVVRKSPLPGYENAADPDLIRAPYKVSSGTERAVFGTANPKEERMRRFIEGIDRKVNRLPEYKAAIIRHRYLDEEEPLPSDTDVWMTLCETNPKWRVSFRIYEKSKAYALVALAYALNLEQVEWEEEE